MNTTTTSNRYRTAGARALLVTTLALAGWLASPGASVAGTQAPPADASPQPATATDATTEIDAAKATDAAKTPAPGATLTPEQIYIAMIEAEKKRRALWRPDPAVPKMLAEQWGVQVIGVQLTAGGYWLRFAFRVNDADKAGMLFDNRYKPYLESEQTGVKLGVPSAAKVGALRTTNRQGNIKNGKIYNIMFSNPSAQVQPGQKVSVVAGEFKVEHLTVN
jgi:hypothetical protein